MLINIVFQAASIWLLTILKNNSKRQCLLEKLSAIQSAFIDFLSENNGNNSSF